MNTFGATPIAFDPTVETQSRDDDYNAQLDATRLRIRADRERETATNHERLRAELSAAAAIGAQHEAEAVRALEPGALLESITAYLTNHARREMFDRAMPATAIAQLRQEIDALHRIVLLLARAIR